MTYLKYGITVTIISFIKEPFVIYHGREKNSPMKIVHINQPPDVYSVRFVVMLVTEFVPFEIRASPFV